MWQREANPDRGECASIRRVLVVRGLVQGVGFRPFVFGLARRFSLTGMVRNHGDAVWIEIEGGLDRVRAFTSRLGVDAPPLARIDDLHFEDGRARGDRAFRIESSAALADGAEVLLPADVATCSDCLRELFDASDRRYRYPFINCTNCGPRLTIIRRAPYDREHTTMQGFSMCTDCRGEYSDPVNRRFHAQPIACPACGPTLTILTPAGQPITSADPIQWVADSLRRGLIVAIKGLGGYHLACDAANDAAVRELRRRKRRDEKPFAVMVRDLAGARAICRVSTAAEPLLVSKERPIVLIRREGGHIAESVAPFCRDLGIMLAYAPVHHLLMDCLGGIPIVMTSGNRSDEPMAFDDRDALRQLGDIADNFLTHDRPIHERCDDSVHRIIAGRGVPLRRSRGFAPASFDLPVACGRPMLAMGGHMKVVFALGRGRRAILSHHIGDLEHTSAVESYKAAIARYEELFAVRPELIVHDLHPEYASTQLATMRAGEERIESIAVQHHHAHVAACMAEHGRANPVIGVAFDGLGYGSDGTLWGGEFLLAGLAAFSRAAHLRRVALPGGERAVREPWRMALAHLIDAGCPSDVVAAVLTDVEDKPIRVVTRMLERGLNAPLTSSAGRLFDAAAAIAGVRSRCTFEGQAAMQLESLAADSDVDDEYVVELEKQADGLVLDTRPLIAGLVADRLAGKAPAVMARRFHSTLASAVVQICGRIGKSSGLATVVLTGGVFQNEILSVEAERRVSAAGFEVLRHLRVPPNDGGLALGQLAVAAARHEVRACA